MDVEDSSKRLLAACSVALGVVFVGVGVLTLGGIVTLHDDPGSPALLSPGLHALVLGIPALVRGARIWRKHSA